MSRDLREEVARAFYDAPEGIGWDYIADPDVKEWYLACADAALSAALPVIERETREAVADWLDARHAAVRSMREPTATDQERAAAIRSQP
jgi:hypothetical protein